MKRFLFSVAAAIVAVALCAVIFTSCLFDVAEPTYTISGRVTIYNLGEPLAGASVTLKYGDAVKGRTTTTASGYYAINDVTDGTYTIEVSKDGYVTETISLVVVLGADVSGKDLELTKNRLQATQGGVGVSVYISEISYTGNYVTIFLTSAAKGRDDAYYGPLYDWGDYRLQVTLQDFYNPARYWNPVNSGRTSEEEKAKGAAYITFENVTGNSFSLTNKLPNPDHIFSRIDLNLGGNTSFPEGEAWFWPRPRATQAATNVDQYIVLVKKSGIYTTFYLSSTSFGRDDSYYGTLYDWGGYKDASTLKNLDTNETWKPINVDTTGSDDKHNGVVFVTFENVTGTRFSLANTMSDPDSVFNLITLPNEE